MKLTKHILNTIERELDSLNPSDIIIGLIEESSIEEIMEIISEVSSEIHGKEITCVIKDIPDFFDN